jgi:GNAT superfamily N-acetyltransferase
MDFRWIREQDPRWDEHKRAAFGAEGFGAAGFGARAFGAPQPGDALGDQWWQVLDGDTVVGLGRLDSMWGDAEILVGVLPEHRRRGLGGWILRRLEDEASAEGLNYLYNKVDPEQPDAKGVSAWLAASGFVESIEGEWRKRIGSARTGTGVRTDP